MKISPRVQTLLCLALPLAGAVCLFWPCLSSNLVLFGTDLQALAWPMGASARHAWDLGEWPSWLPEILGGLPGMASNGSPGGNPLYPLWFLFSWLGVPVPAGFGYDALFHVCLSAWGAFAFARLIGVSRSGALVAAAAWAFSGTQTSLIYAGHLNNLDAYAWIPWLFWCLGLAFKSARPPATTLFGPRAGLALCGLAFGFSMQILALGMQIFAYALLGTAALACWLEWARPWQPAGQARGRYFSAGLGWSAAGFLLAVGLGFLLAAPQLLPAIHYQPFSWREGFSYKDFISWSFPPAESLQWLVPGFFGWRYPTYTGSWDFSLTSEYFGLLPWALAFAAVASGWREKRGWARFFVILALASFVIALGKYTPLLQVFYHLPVYRSFRTWTRFLCLLTFSVSMLAGLGWDALKPGSLFGAARRGSLAFAALALAAGIACLWAGGGRPIIQSSALRCLGLGAGLALAFWLLPRLQKNAKLALLALPLALGFHAFDISGMLGRYVTFTDPSSLLATPSIANRLPDPRAPEPYRIFPVGNFWQPNQGMLYGLESVEGYHGVQMAGHIKLQKALAARPQEYFKLMGVRYFLASQALGEPWLKPFSAGPDGVVSEYPAALPRAFVVGKSRLAAGPDDALAFMANPAFNSADEVVVLKGEPLDKPLARYAKVDWQVRTPLHFELHVDTSQPSYLVVSQSWYPDWQAWVDGKPAEILQADGSLQALRLDAGVHAVIFRYVDGWLKVGWALAGLGWLLVLAAAWRAFFKP